MVSLPTVAHYLMNRGQNTRIHIYKHLFKYDVLILHFQELYALIGEHVGTAIEYSWLLSLTLWVKLALCHQYYCSGFRCDVAVHCRYIRLYLRNIVRMRYKFFFDIRLLIVKE